jgi:hypothetical protein
VQRLRVIEADGAPIKNTAGEVIGRWYNGNKFFSNH